MDNKDIIELLLLHDLTELCFIIFNELDSHSFVNCRLVCHIWNDFIKYYFFEQPKGKKCLQMKLSSNFLSETYKPKITLISEIEKVSQVIADEENVCISTKSGSISMYNSHSLKHLWTLKVYDEMIQHCMDTKRIFVVTSDSSRDVGHIFILDRQKGKH